MRNITARGTPDGLVYDDGEITFNIYSSHQSIRQQEFLVFHLERFRVIRVEE